MRIEAATPRDVQAIAANMRETDAEEFLAVSPATDRDELAAILAERYGNHPGALCAHGSGGPIAIGAMVEARPNVITLMFFATDAFPVIAAPLTRFIVQRLFPAYRRTGVHRIECVSIAGYAAAHRWIECLGLAREAVLPGYGRAGETFLQFAWVAERVRSSGNA